MMFTIPFRSMVLTMEAMTHEYAVGRQVAERYMLNELAAADREAFEEHFFSCHECAEDLRAVEAFAANARAVLAEELGARPSVATSRHETAWVRARKWLASWTSSWQMSAAPAFASAALLALVGYQGLVQIPALRATLERIQSPQPLATAVLHTATRGEGTSVRLAGSEMFAQLSFDVHGAPAASAYFCQLVSADGKDIFSLRVDAPPPGLSVNLLVPASLLEPGRYTLNVSVAEASPSSGEARGTQGATAGAEIDTYDFVVQRQ